MEECSWPADKNVTNDTFTRLASSDLYMR